MSSDSGERLLLPLFMALSAAGLVGIAAQEGYTDKAVIPVPGDKPTIGFGSTEGVRLGDKTTPPKALARALKDVQAYEGALRQCVKVPLRQYEYDAFVSLAYNVGPAAFCGSTLVKKLAALDYPAACGEVLRWRYFAGRDCSLPKAGCSGLWARRQWEYQLCTGANP
jgi:lysozyme